MYLCSNLQKGEKSYGWDNKRVFKFYVQDEGGNTYSSWENASILFGRDPSTRWAGHCLQNFTWLRFPHTLSWVGWRRIPWFSIWRNGNRNNRTEMRRMQTQAGRFFQSKNGGRLAAVCPLRALYIKKSPSTPGGACEPSHKLRQLLLNFFLLNLYTKN